METYHFRLNGVERSVKAYPLTPLLDILYHQFQHRDVKDHCDAASCGANHVLVDGRLANSRLLPIAYVDGKEILTPEGLTQSTLLGVPRAGGAHGLHPVEAAFTQAHKSCCAHSPSGILLATVELLRLHPLPTDAQIRTILRDYISQSTDPDHLIQTIRTAAEKVHQSKTDGSRWYDEGGSL